MNKFLKWICVISLSVFGLHRCHTSEWNQEILRKEAARYEADRTPHVIREADGCKVYAFMSDGRWHYFTRCQSMTTTETTRTEKCGKNCTKEVSEFVTTENVK